MTAVVNNEDVAVESIYTLEFQRQRTLRCSYNMSSTLRETGSPVIVRWFLDSDGRCGSIYQGKEFFLYYFYDIIINCIQLFFFRLPQRSSGSEEEYKRTTSARGHYSERSIESHELHMCSYGRVWLQETNSVGELCR